MMKIFIKKVVIFCLIGVLFAKLYHQYQYHTNNRIKEFQKCAQQADVILFGSSVNRYTDAHDTDKRSISEMLNDMQLQRSVVGFSHNAYNAEIFSWFIETLDKRDRVSTLIVPLNIRTFSPEWDLRPQYQFFALRHLLHGLPYFSNIIFDGLSEHEWHSFPIYLHNYPVGTVADFSHINPEVSAQETLRQGFIFHYMQPVSPTHRKIVALKRIAQKAQACNMRLIVYVTPIDIERAQRCNVEGFAEYQRRTVEIVRDALQDMPLEFIDMSTLLPSSQFTYNNYPNEHLTMYGRAVVAGRLSKQLSSR
jgi:hypothetical protein